MKKDETKVPMKALVCVIVLSGCMCGVLAAQGQEESVTTVHGRVLNKVTKEPIARALVTTMGDEYATMTDDRGQFEFKMTEKESQTNSPGVSANGIVLRTNGPGARAGALQARKPGFLPTRRPAMAVRVKEGPSGVTIYLLPEALIVGHVNVPGSEGEVRIVCELYQRGRNEGKETWQPAGTFTTWANGEFRFSGLEAGTYRLITHEQMDRDSMLATPGAELFGYPPIYYPNTTDFSTASAIAVKAGETAQVNLTVARWAYYPVRIPVVNLEARRGMDLRVYPMGHWGPGWSLGYNPMERAIEGILPDGNYTVELDALAQPSSTGMANFVVRGAPFEGAPLHLVQNASVTVNVRTEFQNLQGGAGEDTGTAGNERPVNIGVSLRAIEEFASNQRELSATVVEGSNNRTLVIDNVRPGRYQVRVYSGDAYTAAIQCGGSDLMKQPLVVGMGGALQPIEVILRNDGARVTGTVEDETNQQGNAQAAEADGGIPFFYLIPIRQGAWQPMLQVPEWNGVSQIGNVPPGDYVAVVFAEEQRDLPIEDAEFVKSLESKGKRIHVDAGENVNVKLKVNAGSEEE
jgi:hypothetical protein